MLIPTTILRWMVHSPHPTASLLHRPPSQKLKYLKKCLLLDSSSNTIVRNNVPFMVLHSSSSCACFSTEASNARTVAGGGVDKVEDSYNPKDDNSNSFRQSNPMKEYEFDEYDLKLAELVQPIKAYGKVKPSIANARLAQMKMVQGKEANIRGSPWKLNVVCQFVAGLTVPEALKQLMFCNKQKAPLAFNVIRRTANLADIRYGLIQSQLEVAECYATDGAILKRRQFVGRGRIGKKYHRYANFNVKLREIDWELKIAQAQSLHQKQEWFEKYLAAKQEAKEARKEREEIEALEKQQKEMEARKRQQAAATNQKK